MTKPFVPSRLERLRRAPNRAGAGAVAEDEALSWKPERLRGEIERIRADMLLAANELRFEEAAKLRDRLGELEGLPSGEKFAKITVSLRLLKTRLAE